MTASPPASSVPGRTLAVFPGAFRPPHVDHYETVRMFADRADVDEVIVLVTNRGRDIPTTNMCLDVDVAQRIWPLYLQGLSKVRVEVSTTSAVSGALAIIDEARPGDRILVVVGTEDDDNGRRRFGKLGRQTIRPGVQGAVARGAVAARPIRATELRANLALGEAGRSDFEAALPAHIGAADRTRVWSICRESMIDRAQLTERSIRAVLAAQGYGPIERLEAIGPNKADQVYRAITPDETALYLKYANDTVADDDTVAVGEPVGVGDIGDGRPGSSRRKPRRRLKAERMAIKWLSRNVASSVSIPTVVFYDRTTRTLALSEVCRTGRPLADDLLDGQFDESVAARTARFLALAHTRSEPPKPLWDDPDRDLNQWRSTLASSTAPERFRVMPNEVRPTIQTLADTSAEAGSPGFRHLDATTNNVLVAGRAVGMIDFESSANFGDPAYDVGVLVGGYLSVGLGPDRREPCRRALGALVDAYHATVGEVWSPMAGRVVGFAAVELLRRAGDGDVVDSTRGAERSIETACELLTADVHGLQAEAYLFSVLGSFHDAWTAPIAPPTRRRTARRSLIRVDPKGLWAGWVASARSWPEMTIEIEGGEPRSVVEVRVDGEGQGLITLDSLGTGSRVITAGPFVSHVEIRWRSSVVLDGLVPASVVSG